MDEIRKTNELFEMWDGGHCFIRLSRALTNGQIGVLRMPHVVQAQWLIDVGAWAALVQGKKAARDNLIREAQ